MTTHRVATTATYSWVGMYPCVVIMIVPLTGGRRSTVVCEAKPVVESLAVKRRVPLIGPAEVAMIEYSIGLD